MDQLSDVMDELSCGLNTYSDAFDKLEKTKIDDASALFTEVSGKVTNL